MEWVILGCGFVGKRLARELLGAGETVRVCSRNVDKLGDLVALGARPQKIDATKARQFGPALYGARNPIVVYSIPPLSNMPAGEAVRRAAEAATGVGAQRFVYLSSTAVYGPTPDGETVDEDTPISMHDVDAVPRVADGSAVETARLGGLPTVIVRLAAIYGPGRGVRERLKAGTYKLIDDGEHFFSRVHVDDIVGIIRAAADRAPNPALYCVADDRPTTQKEYADWLVARLGCAHPPSVPSLAPGQPRRPVRNRKVSNQRLKRELEYQFKYPSYVEGELAIELERGEAPTGPNEKIEPPTPAPAKAEAPTPAPAPTLVRTDLASTPRLRAERVELPAGA